MAPVQYQAYRRMQAVTSSQAELLVLLYRGAVRFAAKGRLHLEGGDIEAAHKCLLRSQEIVVELMIGIRPSDDPTSNDLNALHHYIYRLLYDANLRKNETLVDEALTHLRALLETWEQIALPKPAAHSRGEVISIDRRC